MLGDYRRNGNHTDSAETIAEIVRQLLPGKLVVEDIFNDSIPDERRSRRRTRTTLKEHVLVLRKVAATNSDRNMTQPSASAQSSLCHLLRLAMVWCFEYAAWNTLVTSNSGRFAARSVSSQQRIL